MSGWTPQTTTNTIDIPAADPWTVLDQEDDAADYGWKQPQYDARLRPSGFDPNFIDNLRNSIFSWGLILVESVGFTAGIRRFVDSRQTHFEGTPAKDGSNLNTETVTTTSEGIVVTKNGSQDLMDVFRHYKRLLGYIHKENLAGITPTVHPDYWAWHTTGRDNLVTLLQSGPQAIMQQERERLNLPYAGPTSILPGFEWVEAWQRAMAQGLVSVQAAHWWATAKGYDPLPHMQMAWETVPPICKLLITLCKREEYFERKLAEEHIQDILIGKRIWWLTTENASTLGRETVLLTCQSDDEILARVMMNYQNAMRDSFDFRLLRDWGYGRLWKKLFLVLDTTHGDHPYADTICAFNGFVQNNSKLAYDLFAVHPIALHDVDPEDICVICQSNFESYELVAELKCNHHFHPECIFTHWDSDTIFNNPCALCRTSQGKLRDQIDFYAEKEDKDYGVEHGLQGLEAEYDIAIRHALRDGVQPHAMPPVLQERHWRNQIFTLRRLARNIRKGGPNNWNVLK